jgi:hypothetical protein
MIIEISRTMPTIMEDRFGSIVVPAESKILKVKKMTAFIPVYIIGQRNLDLLNEWNIYVWMYLTFVEKTLMQCKLNLVVSQMVRKIPL